MLQAFLSKAADMCGGWPRDLPGLVVEEWLIKFVFTFVAWDYKFDGVQLCLIEWDWTLY